MVKRRGSEVQGTGKRPRLAPPPQQQQQQPGGPQQQQQQQGYHEDQEDDDDVTEIREGDDSNDYYDQEGYEEQYEDGSTGWGDGTGQGMGPPPPGGQPQGGPQLMGLLCPTCRTMCQVRQQ